VLWDKVHLLFSIISGVPEPTPGLLPNSLDRRKTLWPLDSLDFTEATSS
jgi:hypothetical protein